MRAPRIRRPLALCAACALPVVAACATGQSEPAHREKGSAILERHCGACHTNDSPIAVESALVVFNLREPDFSARMSDAQLEESLLMLEELSSVPDEDRRAFRAFLDDEIAFRGVHPERYPRALRERGLNRAR